MIIANRYISWLNDQVTSFVVLIRRAGIPALLIFIKATVLTHVSVNLTAMLFVYLVIISNTPKETYLDLQSISEAALYRIIPQRLKGFLRPVYPFPAACWPLV